MNRFAEKFWIKIAKDVSGDLGEEFVHIQCIELSSNKHCKFKDYLPQDDPFIELLHKMKK